MTRSISYWLQVFVLLPLSSATLAFVSQNNLPPLIRRHSANTERPPLQSSHIAGISKRNQLCATSGDDWLSQISPNTSSDEVDASLTKSNEQQDNDPPEDLGNIQIPSTGISVTDELEKAQQDKFDSVLVPITGLPSAAQIVTTANDGITEPVRYLVSLSPPQRLKGASDDEEDNCEEESNEVDTSDPAAQSFVMVDIPPFSTKLLASMRKFLREGKLVAMLITSRDAIHYDEAPAVFTSRRSDLDGWVSAFPEAQVIGYRLDIPRDCRDMITQRLDGYGPWALQEEDGKNVTFVETGRPLTYQEWDEDVAKQVMEEGTTPPDDDSDEDDNDLYTPEAIREREEGKRLLAVYTPGHTFGSLSFIFPEIQACCSGYTIPIEDDRYDETIGNTGGTGPALDFRGYITTSRAGMSRMMESARHVVDTYSDRFMTVLPSRGDPLFVGGSGENRKEALNDIIDQYDKIGKLYEQLGITLSDDE